MGTQRLVRFASVIMGASNSTGGAGGGGGGGPSDPIADLDPLYWFDATTQIGNSSDSLSPTSDTRIGYWGDLSGNGHHMRGIATTATWPKFEPTHSGFGDLPTVRHSSSILTSPTPTITGGEWTAFVVAQTINAAIRGHWLSSSTGSFVSTTAIYEIRSQSGAWNFQGFGVSWSSAATNTTTPSIYAVRVTSGRGEIWELGGASKFAVNTTDGAASVGLNTGMSADQAFKGESRISGIVGWSSGLSNAQLDEVGEALGDKFGFTWSPVTT